jgi:hypothetical protein
MRLGMVGCEFRVHEPPELVEHMRHVAERMGRGVG